MPPRFQGNPKEVNSAPEPKAGNKHSTRSPSPSPDAYQQHHEPLPHTNLTSSPIGQADYQFADADRVSLHRGPPAGWHRTPPDWQDPCYAPTTPRPRSFPKRR